MTVKLIEIRDSMTFIPAMAVKLAMRDEAERYLLRRAGYSEEQITGLAQGTGLRCIVCGYTMGADLAEKLIADNPKGFTCPNSRQHGKLIGEPSEKDYDGDPYIVLWQLQGGPANYDPYSWSNRTMAVAHQFLVSHWHKVESGQVIDVQHILGETQEPKQSERATVRV